MNKAQVIHAADIKLEDYGNLKFRPLYNRETLPNLGCALVEIHGLIDWHRHTKSDTFMYVLKGRGKYQFEGQAAISVKKGDLIYIPRNTYYRDRGRMTLFVSNSPRYQAVNVEQKKTSK